MKVINKMLFFLSVLVLCVPLFCFPVSAGNIYNHYKGYQDSCLYYSNFDDTGYYWSDFLNHVKSNSELNSSDNLIFESRVDSYNYSVFNKSFLLNSPIPFFDCLSSVSETSEMYKFTLCENLYYIVYSYSPTSNGKDCYIAFLSESPFYFTDNSSYIGLSSDTGVGACVFRYLTTDLNVCKFSLYYYTSDITSSNLNTPFKFKSDTNSFGSFLYKKNTGVTSTADSNYTKFNAENIYTNCKDIDLSLLTNVDSINASEFKSSNLSDNISVKLTPDFTIGMDRSIPDSTFGISEDYWSLEVTNNNDFNIQFKCYVIPATGAVNYVSEWSKSDGLKSAAEGLPVLVNTEDFVPLVPDETVWMLEKDQWIYSKETENQEDYYKDTPYLVNKPTSNFFVQAGGTFKQVIKWNQLNLNKNQPYQLLVTACQCPYDRASDIHISLATDNYSQSFKHIIRESYFIVYDDTFSVSNPLYYDSSDTFGGVIANTGSSQVNTDYWKINAIEKDGEIEIRNADYSNGWRLNPDGGADSGTLKEGLFNNLDDISLSDVTKLVQDTGSYLTLVATVFKLFPSWIWILLFAGISGLLVIGVFKMLH